MPLTRDFIETIKARADKSPTFRVGLLKEAGTAFMTGDPEIGRSLLRDYIKCTMGFEELARRLNMHSASLKRMFGPSGNPNTNNLAAIMSILQESEGVTLDVVSRSRPKRELERA